MRIVFFGTSSFAAKILAKLIGNQCQVKAIVTRPDRMKGRHLQLTPPPVKEWAERLCPEVPLFQPEKASAPEFAELLKQFRADLFVVVAYGEIIKKNLLEMPLLGCINVHASLLPKFRGAAPIQRCIMEGENETGITIIEMSPQMDAGDIIDKRAIPISEQESFGEIEPALCELGAQQLLKTIQSFERSEVVRTPQDHSLATFAPKITAEEEKISWERPAYRIHNQIRALSPLPGAWCSIEIGQELKRLKIKKSRVVKGIRAELGTITADGNGPIIACGEEGLQLLEVQMEGKKAMSARDWMRGMQNSLKFLV